MSVEELDPALLRTDLADALSAFASEVASARARALGSDAAATATATATGGGEELLAVWGDARVEEATLNGPTRVSCRHG